jgi:CoA:oxalate CoA-transferase
MSFDKPYEGLRVVDLSQGVAGPYCAMLLGLHGAEVVKIEPLEGDWSRQLMPAYGDNTAFSVAANIGKKSIALDIKNDAGKEIVDRLVAGADIFLQGFRPGVIERLGFSYDRLGPLFPKLIYVSVSGFGQRGPLRDKPAMDPVLQAFTGFMSENHGPDGAPHRTPNIVNDMATALYAQQAVAAALFARKDDGRGRHIEVSLMEAAANLQAVRLMSGHRDGPFKVSMVPNGVFETKDGWIQIVVIRDSDFAELCEALGRPGLADDPDFATAAARLKNGRELERRIGEVVRTKENDYWRKKLTEASVQNEVVQDYQQFVEHPHVKETGLISWLVQPGSETPWAVPNVPGAPNYHSNDPIAPRVGQHSREILNSLGYSALEIDNLVKESIVSD